MRPNDNLFICQSPDDLYGFESRYATGRVLRKFLNENQITPVELLHHWGYAKRLQDEHGQLAAAVHGVGMEQAKALGEEVTPRVRALQQLVDIATNRARDFSEIRRRLPKIDPANVGESSARLRHAVKQGDVGFAFMVQLSYGLSGINSVLARLHTVLGFLKEPELAHFIRQLDRFIADAAGFPDVLQELFGRQRHRAAMIRTLARFVGDQGVAATCANADAQRIGVLMHGDVLPETREMFLRWMWRELAHHGPLNPHDEDQEETLLAQLIPDLIDADGEIIGGERTDLAVNERKLRARQRQLRARGLDDVAHDLPENWHFQSIKEVLRERVARAG